MSKLSEFKKEIGLSVEQLEKLTGYTRQGLYNAFKMFANGKKPSKQFQVCINTAINSKIEEETLLFTQRIERLKQLQEELNGVKEG